MDWKHERRRRLLKKWRRQQAAREARTKVFGWLLSYLIVGGFWAFVMACILSMPVE